DPILDAIVERCQSLTGAAAAGIFRVDSETHSIGYLRAAGVSQEFVTSLRVRVGEGTAGRAIRERAPVWTEDILNDPTIPLDEATRQLDLDNAGFRLLEGDELVVAGLAGTAPETMLRARIKVDEGQSLAGHVVATRAAVIGELAELPAMTPEVMAADRRLGYTHYM